MIKFTVSAEYNEEKFAFDFELPGELNEVMWKTYEDNFRALLAMHGKNPLLINDEVEIQQLEKELNEAEVNMPTEETCEEVKEEVAA